MGYSSGTTLVPGKCGATIEAFVFGKESLFSMKALRVGIYGAVRLRRAIL